MVTLFLLVIYAAFISLGLPDALLGVAWPVMYVEYAVPVGLAGLVSMTISVNTIISSVLSGRVLKRFGTGRVTVVSVLMTATALLGFSAAPGFIWLVLLAIPLGLGAGSVDAGLNDYVAKNYEARHMSWLHSFWGVGALTGPIIFSQILSRGEPWRNGYLIVAVVQFGLVFLLFATLPLWEKIARLKRRTDLDSSSQSVDVLHASTETGRKSVALAAKGVFAPLRIDGVKPVLIVFLFYCGIESTMGLWGASYLIRVKGIDVATAAAWVSLFYGSITFGRFISGFVTMRMSSKTLIRSGEIAILIGIIALLLPLADAFSMLGFVLIGLGCAPIFPSMLHETPARFGDAEAQNIMGFQMAVAYIGTSLFPPIFGAIASVITFALFPFFIVAYITLMLVNSERINRYMLHKQQMRATA
ncbi:MAG: MFS transporter [Chloroflexi bacterium]|nr:MFS transporter [Chloroflexota bacterium]